MFRSRIVTLLIFISSISTSFADRVAEIDVLLTPVVKRISNDANEGDWIWKTNRNGGYLLRLEMDVTGDEKPEIFIASTLESTKWSHKWYVFDISKDGKSRTYNKPINFDLAWPSSDNGEIRLTQYPIPARPGDETNVPASEISFKVTSHTFTFPEIHENIFSVTEIESKKFQPSDPENLPKFKTILLSDYLAEPTSEWIEVASLKLDASDCYYLSENKIKAEGNKNFTPQYALDQLASKKISVKSISNFVDSKAESNLNSPNQSDTGSIPQKYNFVSRLFLVMMIFILAGLAWYARKNYNK